MKIKEFFNKLKAKFTGKKESKLSPKAKKIIDIVVIALQVAIVIICVTISAIVLANPSINRGEVSNGKTKLLPVLTDSMEGGVKGLDGYAEAPAQDGINEGDLVISTKPKNPAELKVGDIITFKLDVVGEDGLTRTILDTHRIVEVGENATSGVFYYTKGDNVAARDVNPVYADEVLAVYKTHLKGVGSAISWLQDSTHFLLVIVIPLIVLFLYNVIMFVRMMMQAKMEKQKEQFAMQAADAVDEEEIKRKAIEEYLASQKEAEKDASEKPDEK